MHFAPKDREQILSQLLLRKSETAHIWKKLDYFTFNVFSLFAGDDLKTSDLELYFGTVVRYKCFCKISTLRNRIYLLEKLY